MPLMLLAERVVDLIAQLPVRAATGMVDERAYNSEVHVTQLVAARDADAEIRFGEELFNEVIAHSIVDKRERLLMMADVKNRYRGTTKHFHVLAELVRTAQYRGVTTYQDIAVIMGLPQSGNHMASEVGRVLGEISEDEVEAGRPMLSSVAVGVKGKPGPGFFRFASQLRRFSAGDDEDEFWEQERAETYDAWKRPLSKAK